MNSTEQRQQRMNQGNIRVLTEIHHSTWNMQGIDTVDIYFKTYFLKEKNEIVKGVFSGVDYENRLVNGNVFIEFRKE